MLSSFQTQTTQTFCIKMQMAALNAPKWFRSEEPKSASSPPVDLTVCPLQKHHAAKEIKKENVLILL